MNLHDLSVWLREKSSNQEGADKLATDAALVVAGLIVLGATVAAWIFW